MEPVEGKGSNSRVPLGRFLLALFIVWLASWLPIGLYLGDFDYVLNPVSRDTWYRQLYQGLLYSGMLVVFVEFWRRHAPAYPKRGRASDLMRYLALGLFGSTVLKLALILLGARAVPALPTSVLPWLVALASALAVAGIEESVFRGFLLGGLTQRAGALKATVITSAVFASVHLFRTGTLEFKLGYGLGLFLLAVFLARIACRCSLAASAGFHSGVIFGNFLDQATVESSWWAGWQNEPSSGALAWVFTAVLWAQWEWWQKKSANSVSASPEPGDASLL